MAVVSGLRLSYVPRLRSYTHSSPAVENPLRACANRRVAYVSRTNQKAVGSLSEMPCAKICLPIGAASKGFVRDGRAFGVGLCRAPRVSCAAWPQVSVPEGRG